MLTAYYPDHGKMEWLQFDVRSHQQMVPYLAVMNLFPKKEDKMQNSSQSPRSNTKKKNSQQQQQQQPDQLEPPHPIYRTDIPMAMTTDYGIPSELQFYLEVRSYMLYDEVIFI